MPICLHEGADPNSALQPVDFSHRHRAVALTLLIGAPPST
ncbi:MAG: hypothetical protein OJF50_003093 [Nitrospira sp.]|nr:hypothetical protein [Nitrospira sp.]